MAADYRRIYCGEENVSLTSFVPRRSAETAIAGRLASLLFRSTPAERVFLWCMPSDEWQRQGLDIHTLGAVPQRPMVRCRLCK